MLDPDYSVTKESPLWTAKFDYKAQGEDELSLRKGQIVVLLSKDAKISGDEVIFLRFFLLSLNHNEFNFRAGGQEN